MEIGEPGIREQAVMATGEGNPRPLPDSYYVVTVGRETPVIGPQKVQPAFGQHGGGMQVVFPSGTPRGSLRGPVRTKRRLMTMIKVTPIYGNGWFGPATSEHIGVPSPFDARDVSHDGNRILSIVSDDSNSAGMIMERSRIFAENPDDYDPYSVNLYPPNTLDGTELKTGISPDYQGYALIETL